MKIYRSSKTAKFLAGAVLLAPACCWGNLAISPLRSELSGSPGTELSGTLTIRNQSPESRCYEITAENVDPLQKSAASWIRLSTNSLDLLPNETRSLDYSITLAADARGELLGRIGFSEAPIASAAPVTIRTKISVSIHVVITGTEVYKAVLRDVRVSSTDPVRVEMDIENQGNILLHPAGTCRLVEKPGGRPVVTMPVNSEKTPLYTGVHRTFLAQAPESLAPGTYEVVVRIEPAINEPLLERQQTLFVPDPAQKAESTSE